MFALYTKRLWSMSLTISFYFSRQGNNWFFKTLEIYYLFCILQTRTHQNCGSIVSFNFELDLALWTFWTGDFLIKSFIEWLSQCWSWYTYLMSFSSMFRGENEHTKEHLILKSIVLFWFSTYSNNNENKNLIL